MLAATRSRSWSRRSAASGVGRFKPGANRTRRSNKRRPRTFARSWSVRPSSALGASVLPRAGINLSANGSPTRSASFGATKEPPQPYVAETVTMRRDGDVAVTHRVKQRSGSCPLLSAHSARSSVAVGVRDAIWPGMAATRLASISAPTAMRAIVAVGTVGCGTAWSALAKRRQNVRPTTMPTGTPIRVPMAMATVDCHATTAASWRGARPSALNMAKSRWRRRTDATRVSASAAMAPTASPHRE